jgi:hypothetical protein
MGLVVALLAACAQPPETILPAYVPASTYDGYSCGQLLALQQRIFAELETAELQQKGAAVNDTWGVVMFGLPTASMSGGNIAPRVASLKGQRETFGSLITAKQCIPSG